MEPFERPSTWVLALAVGLLVPGVAALAQLGHAAQPAAWYALLGLVSSAAVLGLVHGVPTLAGLALLLLSVRRELQQQRQAATPPRPDGPQAPAAPADDPAPAENELTRSERARVQEIAHWRVFYRRLWAAGSAYGWEIRTLATKGAPTYVCSQPAWRVGTDQLRLAGLLYKSPGEPTRPLVTSQAWDDGRLWETVPCPGSEPPEIAAPPYTAQQAPQQTAVNVRVVDGTRAD